MELRKVEAIKVEGSETDSWNRFWWEEVIDGKTYQMEQDVSLDFDLKYAMQYVQDQFDEKKMELEKQ